MIDSKQDKKDRVKCVFYMILTWIGVGISNYGRSPKYLILLLIIIWGSYYAGAYAGKLQYRADIMRGIE